MDLFYKIVLSVAIIVLILMLIAITIMMQNANKEVAFPPSALKCPDYWIDSSFGCSPNSVNLGTLANPTTIDFDNNSWKTVGEYSGLSDTCAKRKWANRNKILWDGISNYNSC
jgi:hypothetical protein